MSEPRLQGVKALQKHTMKTSSVVFMLYCLVAAGAFGIEEMISTSGPGLTLLMLILFPIFWALPISEIVAELGAVLPSEGGAYVWAKEGLGEFWGWQVGFWGTFGTWLSQATYVVLVVGYLGKFIELSPVAAMCVKVGMILVFTIINLLGIEEVSTVSTILSICVMIGFAAVCVVGFMNWNYNPIDPFMSSDEGVVGSLGGSVCVAIWMYCGYECMSNTAGEIKNPEVIPRGLIICMPLIALSYFLPTLAGLASVGNWDSWGVEENCVGYMDVLATYAGPAAGIAFLIVAIISQCSIFNAYVLSGSRGFFAMSDDHLFPPFLCKVSKKRGVPHVSIIVMACVTMLTCQLNFETLVMATTPLMLYLYMSLAIAIVRLRKVYPVEERKEKGVYFIPFKKAGLVFCTILPFIISMIALYVNGTEYFLSGYMLLAVSLILYLICKWAYGGLAVNDPEHFPINPKTKLAKGNLSHIGIYLLACGIAALLGRVLLAWYEGDWGAEYYLEEYGSGLFSNFDLMLQIILILGIVCSVIGVIFMAYGFKKDPVQPLVKNEHVYDYLEEDYYVLEEN